MMSTFLLKLIALIAMTIDHIGVFIPGAPIWFRWIGRISAPLFIFCFVWGLEYGRNRKKKFLLLYFCSIAIETANQLLNYLIVKDPYEGVHNNIFGTFVVIMLCIYILEHFKWRRMILFAGGQLFLFLFISSFPVSVYLESVILRVTCSVFTAEGNLYIVILGVLLYFTKGNRKRMTAGYTAYILGVLLMDVYYYRVYRMLEYHGFRLVSSAMYFLGSIFEFPFWEKSDILLLTNQYRWMMIFALPLMLLYNYREGPKMKYFFYVYYPAHIYLLFLIGRMF